MVIVRVKVNPLIFLSTDLDDFIAVLFRHNTDLIIGHVRLKLFGLLKFTQIESDAGVLMELLCRTRLHWPAMVSHALVLIGSRHKTQHSDTQLRLEIENQMAKKIKSTNMLGVQLDENLNWLKHIDYISTKVSFGIGAIKKLRNFEKMNMVNLSLLENR